MTNNNTPVHGRKPFRAVVGIAHHALRAYAKAYTMQAGGQTTFRYHLPQDGRTAAIVDATGTVVVERPIEQWATEGAAVRRALIGLKAMRERIARDCSLNPGGGAVRFHLDVLTNTAVLTVAGKPVGKDELLDAAAELGLSDNIRAALQAQSLLMHVADWAAIGRQFEVDFYLILQSAERFGFADAAKAERERGCRLGILRRKQEAA